MQSILDMFKEAVDSASEHYAIKQGDSIFTIRDVDMLSSKVACGLLKNGIAKGDRIGLYSQNSAFYPIVYLGILKAGATAVPINILLNPKEIAFILSDAGAKALFYSDFLAEPASKISGEGWRGAFNVCMGSGKFRQEDYTLEMFFEMKEDFKTPAIEPAEDLAAILYTSGTTGRPKGAMLTHRNIASNLASIRKALKIQNAKERIIVVLPMFHAFAATAAMLTSLVNACLMLPLAKFDPMLVAETIHKEQATIFMGVPSMYIALLRLGAKIKEQLASLRLCVSGGAALPVAVLEEFERCFGKIIYEGDGPTECSPVTCVNPIGGKVKPGTVGLPIPDVEMKIMDDNGNELPRGVSGEICVRGPNVMKGYWKLPEDTRQAFFGEWFRTGDIGIVDEDGYFSIIDRKKDMIIVNGMNVYPRIVEETLFKHPAILECAVVGEPHQFHGEIPVAFVVLKSGCSVSEKEIRNFCRNFLGRHEIPRKVVFMEALPKNAAGKIVKRALRKHGEIERGVQN